MTTFFDAARRDGALGGFVFVVVDFVGALSTGADVAVSFPFASLAAPPDLPALSFFAFFLVVSFLTKSFGGWMVFEQAIFFWIRQYMQAFMLLIVQQTFPSAMHLSQSFDDLLGTRPLVSNPPACSS